MNFAAILRLEPLSYIEGRLEVKQRTAAVRRLQEWPLNQHGIKRGTHRGRVRRSPRDFLWDGKWVE
jgi:hypothetical protein